jgi:polar amino acid transport system substrate-binding protein
MRTDDFARAAASGRATRPLIYDRKAPTPMRKTLIALLAAAGALAAVAALAHPAAGKPSAAAAVAGCSPASLHLVSSGHLTIGTDNPAYPPWYAGGSKSKWKINDPSTGKGYESAVAYAIAKRLGFARSAVSWTYEPFNKAFAPGPKSFDFDINQISYTPARAKVVTFSVSYYDVNQAIVVNKGTKIASVHSVAGLKQFKLGAQLGTTSYGFITDRIGPSSKPAVYPSNAAAVLALKNKQIDGLVVDLPTAFYVTAVQVPNSKILGQFENKGKATDHFAVALAKGNPLVNCVNKAITSLRTDGTLKRLQQQWLAKATGAPILK